MKMQDCKYVLLTKRDGVVKDKGEFSAKSKDEVDVIVALDQRLQTLIDFVAFQYLLDAQYALFHDDYVIGETVDDEPYVVVLIPDRAE